MVTKADAAVASTEAVFPGSYDQSKVYVSRMNDSRWTIIDQTPSDVQIQGAEDPTNRQSWTHDAFGVYFFPEA